MDELPDALDLVQMPRLIPAQAGNWNDGADAYGFTQQHRQHQTDSARVRQQLPNFTTGEDDLFERGRQDILRKRLGATAEGLNLPPGYRFDVPDAKAQEAWVYDKYGQIAEVGSLRRNIGELERSYQRSPRPETLAELNRWRGALGMPPMQPAAPTQPQGQPDELPDALDLIQGGRPQAAPTRPGSRLGTARNTRDIPNRMRESVYGKQDPNYQGIPPAMRALDEVKGFSPTNDLANMGRYALAASDKDLARMYAQQFGENYVRTETDANGYPVIVYRDKGGQEAKAYVNRPGLDFEDVTRGVVGALPFLKSAQVVNAAVKTAPLVPRMLAQGAGQGATSVAQDATGLLIGTTQPDPIDAITKAGVATVAGAGGEAVGAAATSIWRRLVADRRYFDKAAQKLTPAGEDAAKAAGLDPADFSPQVAQDFAKAFVRTGDADAAFRQAASKEVGIRRSAGELTGNREQLMREQQMRVGTYGTQAREAAEAFDRGQRNDIVRATRGVTPPGSPNPSVAETLAPDRRAMLIGGQMGKTEAGENVLRNTLDARDVAKRGERAAWDAVPKITAPDEALQSLPKVVNDALGDFELGATTPAATKMAQQVGRFVRNEAPQKVDDIIANNPERSVDQVRRSLLKSMRGATTPEDREAAGRIYGAFNKWIDDASDKLVSTDPTAAAKLRTARDATRELSEVFKGQPGSPASRIMSDILGKADTPERVVDALFSGPGGQIKQGSPTALMQLKTAYDKYLPPDQAKRAWDDLRLAYWIKLTADKGNEVKTPGTLSTAIKTMFGDHKSLAVQLFTPQERAQFRRMAAALDEIKRKNPNTSWSAMGVGQLTRDMGNSVLVSLGWNSVVARTVAGTATKPFQGSYGAAQSRRAFGGGDGAQLPSLPGPTRAGYGGAAGAQSQQ